MAVKGPRIEIGYPVHYLGDGLTVCGHALACELVADALRLLIGMNGEDHEAAWDAFEAMAESAAARLHEDTKTGRRVGLVLRKSQ